MNKDDMFLRNLYTLMESGYSVEECLDLCQKIFPHPCIDQIRELLKEGAALDECLLQTDFSLLFKEYFSFFNNKDCLSSAIEKSLNICLSQKKYKTKLKSQLTYPSLLLLFLFLFSIFVVIVLLPQVNALFVSFQITKSLVFQIIYFLFYLVPCILIVTSLLFAYMFVHLIYALRRKRFKTIEYFLKIPFFRVFLQKYFSLKFSIYYQELLNEEMDNVSIIDLLNEQLCRSDLKIVLYEISNRLHEGESLETILNDFEYLDPLFLNFFQMYMKNPTMKDSLSLYIQLTYEQIDMWVSQFLKYLIPCIYGFVAIFVISIYISIIIPMMNVISNV